MASGKGGSRRRRTAGEAQASLGEEILSLVLIGVGIFLTISALSYRLSNSDYPLESGAATNWGGAIGHALGGFFVDAFGLACYPFFAFLVYWGLLLFLRREVGRPAVRVFGALALMLIFAVFLAGPELRGAGPRTPLGFGGGLGHFIAPKLHHSFGSFGVFLLLLMTGIIAFLVATDWPLHVITEDVRGAIADRIGREREPRREGPGPILIGLRRAFAAGRRRVVGLFAPIDEPAPEAVESPEVVMPAAPAAVEPDVAEPEESDDAPEPPRERRRRRRAERRREIEAEAEPSSHVVGSKEARPKPVAKKPAQQMLPISIVGTPSKTARARRGQPDGPYVYPSTDLLDATVTESVADEAALRAAAKSIEKRLASLGLEAKVVRISAGPAVTVFELEVAEGTRVSSVTKFAPDLAAALKAFSVRIVAPIPGKHTIGVEVPNAKRSLVRLRALCEMREPGNFKEVVPLFLGRDVAGKPLIEDLTRMPHLLIAGATGSGKSVCINSILLSILLSKSPDEVRLILIDPKMVELQNYKSIPHLLCPVVTSMKQVPRVLDWAVETMEQRYTLLSNAGVRSLSDYNSLGEEKLRTRLGNAFDPERTPVHLATIVMVIDEFADLMAVAAAEVEVSIQRLAQKSRAVGIHVILATQRPSRDVITGLIKANLPTRIAFQVSSRVDSRVVLDSNGADQLLGHGDMLYIPPGTNRLVRAQGSFVSDDEIHGVVSFLEQNAKAQQFEQTLVQVPTGSGRKKRETDELWDEAVRCILEEQRGSATLLQRKLSIGYTRASRLIELMAEEGLVGEFVGSKSREILMSLEEWDALKSAEQEAEAEVLEAAVEARDAAIEAAEEEAAEEEADEEAEELEEEEELEDDEAEPEDEDLEHYDEDYFEEEDSEEEDGEEEDSEEEDGEEEDDEEEDGEEEDDEEEDDEEEEQ